ncbi:MAG: ABC transporter permease [Rhodobacteraceae bacterium]|nr:ABC transporter permease [Paracoccaceae bacterium]
MTPLDHKLLRDLWRLKGQAVAIGLVIAVGVLVLVMMTGLVSSLTNTRDAYYQRYRLADVFAPAVRAPQHLVRDLMAIPGVAAAEGRITGGALIDLPEQKLPLQARAISLPDFGAPRLNDIYLTDGRRPDGGHTDEILLLRDFAVINNLHPGDTLSATMNGARRIFRIVGLAQSPEFLYATPPGEMAPDDARFAVIWMGHTALSAAYDMKGAFNEALVSLEPQANLEAVLDGVDRLLDPYGGLGAYGLKDQLSNRFISEEINGLQVMSVAIPPIFLGIAAFLLYIVILRMVQAEREQIGLIKAFGYTNAEVATHYFKMILAIAIGGAVAGCLMGIGAGRAMTGLYQLYFKFPFLLFAIEPASLVTGFAISVLAASAGGVFVLRKVFALTPAVAMHPPAPADYSGSGRVTGWLDTFLDQPSRMVLRRLTRHPGQMSGAVIGIAAGMSLSVAMVSLLASFERTLDLTFNTVDRSDLTVTFTHPMSDKTIYELQRIRGVIEVEPARIVPVILRNRLKNYRGALIGLIEKPRLYRAIDDKTAPILLRKDGIILARALAEILDIRPGEMLRVDVLDSHRPKLTIPVAGLSDSLLGSPVYLELSALNLALGQPNRVSGAFLRIDSVYRDAILSKLKGMHAISSVTRKQDTRAAFEKMMDSSSGAMRYVMVAIAAIITFGIVYNSARIAYAERARDLASLQVMGFTKGEVAFVLLGELGVVTLIALPLGAVLGHYLTFAVSKGFSTDLYQIPAVYSPESYGFAAIAVIGSAVVSGWLVKRDIDTADLVSVLKTRE